MTYIDLNSPQGNNASEWSEGPAGKCPANYLKCESYNFGYNTAEYSIRSAAAKGVRSKTWSLDVEVGKYWWSSQAANARVIAGAIAALRAHGLTPNIYSTTYQWDVITGGYEPGTKTWYATGIDTNAPAQWCAKKSFTGGPVSMVQSVVGGFDNDYSC